ncbi:MAG: 30S ribosome-binding factor RbfA [Deltaproteobacteria bacterium]|nr:30S ribosome-binding factor RbfA [Deltaproteobacteria bacterium]
MTSYRKLRVADAIKVEISDLLLRDIKDPRIGLITITKVRLSDDFKTARVYFTNFNNATCDKNAALAGLNSAAGYIQRILGKRLELRYTPRIVFFYDDSFEYEAKIDELIEETKKNRSNDE